MLYRWLYSKVLGLFYHSKIRSFGVLQELQETGGIRIKSVHQVLKERGGEFKGLLWNIFQF